MAEAMQSSAEVSSAAHVPDESATLLRLEGTPVSVKARREMLASLLASHGKPQVLGEKHSKDRWRSLRDVDPLCDGRGDVWRISLPPSEGWDVFTRLRDRLGARGFLDWAGGLLWIEVPPTNDASAPAIRSAIKSGHATLIRAPEPVRAAIDVFQPQPPSLAALSARVKMAFDPHGLFNPARMYRSI